MPQDKRYVVEGYWDCQYCENKGIRGRFKTCPHCGHPRDASVTFFTKEIGHDQAITDEEFARERAEADKNSRSSSVNHSGPVDTYDDQPSLYSRKAGEGRGDGFAEPAGGVVLFGDDHRLGLDGGGDERLLVVRLDGGHVDYVGTDAFTLK